MLRSITIALILAVSGGMLAKSLGFSGALGALLALASAGLAVALRLVLTRMAHSAFKVGRWRRAARLYWLLGWLSLRRTARKATVVSRAACAAGEGNHQRALHLLMHIERADVDAATWASCRNNIAYSRARLAVDLDEALVAVDEALALRPSVAGFKHTRGLVLARLERYREAARALDEVWQASSESSALLESERCFDLAGVWEALGESEYAADYLERSRLAAPGSVWSAKSEVRVQGLERPKSILDLDAL